MIYWCESRNDFANYSALIMEYYRSLIENKISKNENRDGFCINCNQITKMVSPNMDDSPGAWMNLLEGMHCSCGSNGRMRMILNVINSVDIKRSDRLVILERLTPLYQILYKKFKNLIGCEYFGPIHSFGELVNVNGMDIRNEDCMNLSFEDQSIDVFMHFDVLEHLPDARRGLEEIFRVLSKGGQMIFTCPFFHNLEKNIIRSEIINGKLINYLPNGYHGNPLTNEGCLVYIHPSWEIIDWLYEIGFEKVKFAINYSPVESIFSNGCPYPDGHMWPVTFLGVK